MLLVRDARGIEHTDAVFRALSEYRGTPPSMYECFVQRIRQPYVQAAFDENQRRHEAAKDGFQFGEDATLGDEARQFLSDLFAEACDDWTAQKLAGLTVGNSARGAVPQGAALSFTREMDMSEQAIRDKVICGFESREWTELSATHPRTAVVAFVTEQQMASMEGEATFPPEYEHDRAYEAQFRIPVVDLLRYALRHGFVDTLPAEQRAAFEAVVRVALVRDGDAA